jgi:hypothetical protein
MLPSTLPEIREYLVGKTVRARFPGYDTETNPDKKLAYWNNVAADIDAMLTDSATVAKLLAQPAALPSVEMVQGGLYRNPAGAEIRLIEPAVQTGPAVVQVVSANGSGIFPSVLAAAWIATHSSALLGEIRVLVTPEGLAAGAFELIEEAE